MSVNEAFNLTGKLALITGSTRGIGAAIAAEFAEAGASVVVTGRDQGDADAVATELTSSAGDAFGLAYDAAQTGAGARLIAEIEKRSGRLDILVNNAAVLRPHVIAKLGEDEFDEIFAVNTRAAVFLCQEAHRLLASGTEAAVVNVTAACAHRPMGGLGAYCASKAAMINFTGTLAREWAKDGIRVNALTPGTVGTDMILPKDAKKRAAFEQEISSENLMGRLAEPREIARAVRFLASGAASYVTGQTLIVDGGFLA
jgi:NAD(P)-dependent dehydrogenase (short-subunit alcohol dehydrogenase family)